MQPAPGLESITVDPQVMGGKPCIRGMRVTVSMITGLLASGHSIERILEAYPYLEQEDILQAIESQSAPPAA
jgi:uncharacterized protein (DUF433 family)